MISLKRILLATDFSPHAEVARRYAEALATSFGAEVVLCHVLETPDLPSQYPPTGEGYFPTGFRQTQEAHARAECERLLADAVPQARYVLREGRAFLEIIACARDEQADLIVMGTHGRGAIAHLLMGSTAERVVRQAPCPVLVVREGEHDFVLP